MISRNQITLLFFMYGYLFGSFIPFIITFFYKEIVMAKKQKKSNCGALTLARFLSYVQSPSKQPKLHQVVLDHILCANRLFFFREKRIWRAGMVRSLERVVGAYAISSDARGLYGNHFAVAYFSHVSANACVI